LIKIERAGCAFYLLRLRMAESRDECQPVN